MAKRSKLPLDIYEMFIMPKDQIAYLAAENWHFNESAYRFAAEQMYKRNQQSGKDEKLPIYTKKEVDDLLKKYNVTIENKGNYDYVYAAQMCRADFFGRSVEGESKLCLFIKDYCDDEDQADGFILRRWVADMNGKGESIDWLSFLTD